ncbi:hypothetical protein JCM6882_006877 [Rhodosporidiobolus microsporus]
MVIVLRSRTFTTSPPNFLDDQGKPTMSFRDYNANHWTPWLIKSYSSENSPFIEGPESKFARQLDTLQAAGREQVRQMALALLDTQSAAPDMVFEIARFFRWRAMTRTAKEDLLLEIWEAHHELCERHSLGMWHSHAPECTLETLVGADGLGRGMEKLAMSCRAPPNFDVSTARVPVIPNDAFDRMWGINDHAPAVPFSRAKRTSIEYSLAARAHFLLSLVVMWKFKMDGGGKIPTAAHPPPCPVNKATAPCLFELGTKRDIACVQEPAAGLQSFKRYATSKHDIKLLCCSRCKAVGRSSWYCSAQHQKLDWPLHQRVCGRAPGATAEEVGMPGQ